MRVSVIGLGYLGAVTAASLASLGHKVLAIDRDEERINDYMENHSDTHEPGLKTLVKKNVQKGTLSFSSTRNFRGDLGEVAIITVGTPPKADGNCDLRQVHDAIEWVLEHSETLGGIVMKSTVPPGTGSELTKRVGSKKSISYYSCPEFLSEGSALNDFLHPNRIIVGTNTKAPERLIRDLHCGIKSTYLFTNTTTAEMIKCASNVFLSTKISFINSVANLCAAVGANIDDVQKGIGLDPRIGQKYLKPGVGYGGSCLPKDTIAFSKIMQENNVENDLVKAVIKINETQKKIPFRYLRSRIKNIQGLKVSVLGLSFKPNTDDVRESPSISLIESLVCSGASVKAYDPFANENARMAIRTNQLPKFVKSIEECVQDTSVVFVMHSWDEIKRIDWANLRSRMDPPRIVYDGRNSLDPELIRNHDFEYVAVGTR